MRHKLLTSQLRAALGVSDDRALQAGLGALRERGERQLADGLARLLAAVDDSYAAFDRAMAQPLPAGIQPGEGARALAETILDQLPVPVFLKDRAGRFVHFNRTFQQLSQRTREQILGLRIDDFASKAWARVSNEDDAQAWRTGRMVTSERRLPHLDPPLDILINRIVIASGGQSYLLGFVIDVSEQRAARDAMQRAVESAQAASRAKSEFLANMSHEIRTPMNGILGMTELVLESRLDDQQREDIGLVKVSAVALLDIVNDILDFSKIEAGRLDIADVPFDLRRLVHETVGPLAVRARQKGLQLRCEVPAAVPDVVRGDPGRLRQVLCNLLGNAIKFTEHGEVVLALRVQAESAGRCDLAFAVSDTGIGIAPDKQELIFDPFSQVDGSTTRQFGGTGLGLAISRRLVLLMQGRMEVCSAPGAGSTFRFTLPLEAAGVQAPPPVWVAPSAPLAPRAPVPSPAPADAPGACPADAQRRMRILLAEDNQVNQRLALRLLDKMGHRVTLVDNGLDALEQGTHGAFDLILMDVQMPGLDGLAATRRLRQWEREHGGHVPVVAMTARAMQGDRERCLDAGMDEYLSKPIDAQRLRQLVERFDDGQGGPVLDWPAALQRLDGDNDLLLELAALLIDDGPPMQRALVDALDAGDLPGSRRAVHSIKGVLVNFGAVRATRLADRLTASLHQPAQAAQWRALADDLGGALDEVRAALAARIAAHGGDGAGDYAGN